MHDDLAAIGLASSDNHVLAFNMQGI